MNGQDVRLLVDLASNREPELATVNSTLTASAALITRPPVPKPLVQTAGTITKTVVAAGVIVGVERVVTHGISNHKHSSHSKISKVRVEACLVVFSAV